MHPKSEVISGHYITEYIRTKQLSEVLENISFSKHAKY